MKFYSSLSGTIRIEVTAADMGGLLDGIASRGIAASDILLRDDLTAWMTVDRRDIPKIKALCEKRGDVLNILGVKGLYWNGKQLVCRPVLLTGLVLLFLISLWIPKRVFFVQVEGNSAIPTRQILEEAGKCGIGFGAGRKAVRSEKVKNALLEAIPQLQWAGVNTRGCVAVITVRERTETPEENDRSQLGHIVAVRDGIITDCTATSGSLLCAPGQAVSEGDILISGYTDCGLSIRAEQAQGEIYAMTRREITVAMVPERVLRQEKGAVSKKISILFGKKRINLWKDSGISDSTCDRMYEEYYITLPGGFQLPLAIAVERFTGWETAEEYIPEQEAQLLLTDFGASCLQGQMVAGRILKGMQTFSTEDGRITMAGQYVCTEMIGKMRRLQIGEYNGESN